jgi:hypothetical protein
MLDLVLRSADILLCRIIPPSLWCVFRISDSMSPSSYRSMLLAGFVVLSLLNLCTAEVVHASKLAVASDLRNDTAEMAASSAVAAEIPSPVLRWSGYIVAAAVLCVSVALLERARLVRASQGLPGPAFLPPFIGGVVAMVRDPYTFWHSAFARGPVSWTALGPKLVLVVSDAHAVKSIFSRCSARFPLCLSLNSKPLLGK